MDIKNAFAKFLFDEVGSSGRGTVSTYIRALDVLNEALKSTALPVPFRGDVWSLESPAKLMALQEFVVEQQKVFVSVKSGIFSSLSSGGRSYYEKRWCSAAVRQLAAFRQSAKYESELQSAFTNSSQGKDVAEKANKVRIENVRCFVPENVDPSTKQGKDAVTLAKKRINQSVFRKWIIGLYESKCCVTGLCVPELLRASHIVGWADDKENRMNPCNGLCLSATYDAAFDKHLITFDDDYRMVLSKRIRDFCTSSVCAEYFLKFEGARIHLPTRFCPDKELLDKHHSLLIS